MENKNIIETVAHQTMTKQEIIDAINKTFPDDVVGGYGQIAQVVTTTMTDGTVMQSVCFGKVLKNK